MGQLDFFLTLLPPWVCVCVSGGGGWGGGGGGGGIYSTNKSCKGVE